MKSSALSIAQQSFIHSLLANGYRVAETAKAKGINPTTASRWLAQPSIKAYLEQCQAIVGNISNVTAAEVVGRLVALSRADLADILPNDPVIKEARKNGQSHLIKKFEKITVTRTLRNGEKEVEERVKLEMHDAVKPLLALVDLLGLKTRDDELERARTAIRTAMTLNNLSPEAAILQLSPHYPAVIRLREEFCGAAIDVTPKTKEDLKANG